MPENNNNNVSKKNNVSNNNELTASTIQKWRRRKNFEDGVRLTMCQEKKKRKKINSIRHSEMEKKKRNFEDGVRLPMCQEIIIIN